MFDGPFLRVRIYIMTHYLFETNQRWGYLLTFFFVLLFISPVWAQQGRLEGRVHFSDGAPASHISIQLSDRFQTMTDAQGRYTIAQVPYGNYQMRVSSLEIEGYTLSVVINRSVQRQDLEVVRRADVQIETVSVQGKMSKQRIEESGFAAQVIDTRQAAIRNVQINELLDQTVGVRVRQNGGLGAGTDYNLNGMSGRAVGIFIDGIDVSTYGSSFNLSNIPASMIERIEVYKGVLPAHLSGDLLGGAINVVLRKDVAVNNLSASVSYGSFNTQQADVHGNYRDPNTGFTFRGSAFYAYSDNDYEIWGKFARNTLPDGTMEHVRTKRFYDAYRSAGAKAEFGFTDVSWADSWLIGYQFTDTYNEIQHGQYMTQPYMGRFSESNAHIVSMSYHKNHLFTPGLQLRLNGVYSDRQQYLQDTVSWNYNWSGEKMIGFHGVPIKTSGGAQQGAPTMNRIYRQIGTARGDLSYYIDAAHKVSLNHVFSSMRRRDSDEIRHVAERLYQSRSVLDKHVSTLAYEAEWWGRRLRTNLFGKVYTQSTYRREPAPKEVDGEVVYAENHRKDTRHMLGYGFALTFQMHPNLNIFSSGERAVRMPSESEIFGGPEENIIANPSLRPELSDNINLGLRWRVWRDNAHQITLSANGFARNTKDKIVRRAEDRLVNEAVQTMPFENLGLTQSIGVEGEMHYVYADRFTASWNFSKFNTLFKQKTDPATGMRLDRYNKQVPNEPFFTVNAHLQYHLQDVFMKRAGMDLHYHLAYVDPFNTIWIDSPNTMTPTQFSHDIGASYRFPNGKFILSADVKNIFNAQLYDNFAVQKPGRALYLKLNVALN